MSASTCRDCGKEVDVTSPGAPVGEVRMVGRDGRGNVCALCPRCWIKRGKEEARHA